MSRMSIVFYLEANESVYNTAYKTMFIVKKEINEEREERFLLIGKVSNTNIT